MRDSCHTARNLLGAERGGSAYLGGAVIKGWEAPALTSLTRAPVPWTETQFFSYLRQGHSAQHGVAAGPMAPVVTQLSAVPDTDLRAMAHYLASFNPPLSDAEAAATAQATVDAARASAPAPGAAQRLFQGACGSCHHDGDGPRLLGVNVPLALNSNLHSDRPDNLLRIILEGHTAPATRAIGFMPAFDRAFDDRQIVDLVAYMRQRFAPAKPAWGDLPAATARVRAEPSPP